MQFIHRTAAGDVDLDLVRAPPVATVGDLVAALDPGAASPATVRVDGRLVDSYEELGEAGMVCGSVIEVGPTPAAAPRSAGEHLELAIVGGPDAGRRFVLAGPVVTLGRSPGADVVVADPTVSPRHWRLRQVEPGVVQIADLSSHNGTRVGGNPVVDPCRLELGALVCFGTSEAIVRSPDRRDRPAGLDPRRQAVAGTVPLNRPPRIEHSQTRAPIPVPDPPVPEKRRPALSLVALIAPVVTALVLVLVLGSLRYALFALMSPVLVLSNAWASRRRHRRESRTTEREFAAALARFDDDLRRAASVERRRREHDLPDLAELARRTQLPSTRLWERRPGHGDELLLRLGRGPVRWEPPVDVDRVDAHAALVEAVARWSVLSDAAVALDLAGGAVVGIAGHRPVAVAVARSLLLQACILHGPADLPIAILVAPGHVVDWDWTKWLPHVRQSECRRVSSDTDTSAALMSELLESPVAGGLVLVDDPALLVGRGAPTRAVLNGRAGPITGIVLAPSADRLPSGCTQVIRLRGGLGEAVVVGSTSSEASAPITVTGCAEATARDCAVALARYDDPELDDTSATVPARVTLLSSLGGRATDPTRIVAGWIRQGSDASPAAPLGIGPDGPVRLDLVVDGPHALVAGTTGAGKSELLRSLVAGLAVGAAPTDLVFVLIDYKGGSAFDACSRLPHTVGLVTDLDAHLGERALVSLEAELQRRERVLRDSGATDLGGYRRQGSPGGPLPRLVLVVDEFATMAAELPDFVGSLVGIAQRGRSLGVHMILATQRPSGVVNANIKANTNIRIALRVQDAHDSTDVIDGPSAAMISRSQPGRAYVRLGSGEVVPVQTPLASATTAPAGSHIELRSFTFGPATDPGTAPPGPGATDLELIVDACCKAAEPLDLPRPRSPWLPMLDSKIELASLLDDCPDHDRAILVGLADDPARQRQEPAWWLPAEGHLALLGKVGSGTSSGLVSVALAGAFTRGVDELHVYGLDLGGGSLSALETLPHVGAVVGANERERLVRLVELLAAEVGQRRDQGTGPGPARPLILLLVDGAPALLAELEGLEGQPTLDALTRILGDGAGVGVAVALTADRPMALPMRLLSALPRRLMFRHADPADFAMVGRRPAQLPAFVPGRAVDSETGLVTQVPIVTDLAATLAEYPVREVPPHRQPMAVEPLSGAVPSHRVADHLRVGAVLHLPVGIAEPDRAVAGLDLHPGEHLLVAGPPRSGVSTTLRLLGGLLRRAGPEAVTVAVAGPSSPLRADASHFDAVGEHHQLDQVLELARRGDGRDWLVVVDDAHLVDEAGALEVLARRPGRCRLLVGGRADHLHGQYGHWTRHVRRAGSGVLLSPRLDADGDLLGVRLPRRISVPMVPGRGFAVSRGQATLVQVAGADLSA